MMKNKVIHQLLYYSYCFLMVSFFLPLKINSIALIVTGAISVMVSSHLFNYHKKQPLIFFFLVLFIILLVGLKHTENLAEGWAIIERHYALLFVPFFAPSFNLLSTKKQNNVLNVFIFTVSITSLYCLAYAAFDYLETGSVYISGYSGFPIYNKFMHHRLVAPIGMHAIFYSLYLAFAFIIILNRFILKFFELSIGVKFFYIFNLLFYLVLLILLKSSLFALALPVSIFFLMVFHFSNKIANSLRFKSLSLIVVIAIGAYSLYGINSKIRDFSTEFEFSDPRINSLKIRLGIWICSLETIKEDWLIGQGTGDAQDALINTYRDKNFVIGLENKFNAHNMYLQYWLSNGLFALAMYCFLLLYLIIHFLKQKQVVPFLVIFLFAMFSMTESTMLKQNGIIFFVLFSSIFYSLNKKVESN